jgi:hypothetical protein
MAMQVVVPSANSPSRLVPGTPEPQQGGSQHLPRPRILVYMAVRLEATGVVALRLSAS